MPIRVFLSLAGLFLIGTMANIAGNGYGYYLSFIAVCIFSVLMLMSELKKEKILHADNRRIRWGNMLYSVLLAAYLIALTNLAIDWTYSTSLYLLVALLIIFYRFLQTTIGFFLLIFQKTKLRQFGKLLVFTCIDTIFLAQVLMEELQIMDMSSWRLYTNTGFIIMNSVFIIMAFFNQGGFLPNLKKRYPASLSLTFYLITIGFVGYQSASDAGYLPKLEYAIFHSPETSIPETRFLKKGDFEALTIMKFNLNAFWNRQGGRNILMSKQTPFVTSQDCKLSLFFDPRYGVSWEISESTLNTDK